MPYFDKIIELKRVRAELYQRLNDMEEAARKQVGGPARRLGPRYGAAMQGQWLARSLSAA
jgi:hypothetical protein